MKIPKIGKVVSKRSRTLKRHFAQQSTPQSRRVANKVGIGNGGQLMAHEAF
jgi:hypothetical protein